MMSCCGVAWRGTCDWCCETVMPRQHTAAWRRQPHLHERLCSCNIQRQHTVEVCQSLTRPHICVHCCVGWSPAQAPRATAFGLTPPPDPQLTADPGMGDFVRLLLAPATQ